MATQLFKRLWKGVKSHGPEILIGLGITGFIGATVMAVQATPIAEDLIVAAEDEKGDELTVKEKVKAVYKPYIPAAVTTVASTACILGASKINHQRNTELAAAYAISQAVIKHYDDKTAELAGEEKANEIKTAVHREMARDPMVQERIRTLPNSQHCIGMYPYYDPISNSPFYATKEILDKVEVTLNKRMYCGTEPYITVDDLYEELNDAGIQPKLKSTAVTNMLGWTLEEGGIDFDSSDYGEWDDGTPCRVMSYKPHHDPRPIR